MDRTPSGVLPYPGLRPFRADEADIFFGREQQTDELLSKLQSHRFIAVTGPSGCGKSSLVKAGLIPALRAGFMLAAGSRWRYCEVRPGQHPILSLATALASPQVLGEDHDELPYVEAALRFGPLGLVQVVRESALFRDASLLVLVDQFEEIFRFRERIDPDEADAFVRLLLTSAGEPDVPVYVVITMRSDYLGDCALFHGLPEAINAGQYLTPRLTREQCAAAIVGPARVCGGDVDPALVNRLLNDFGPDPDQLPLLQHALMRMWVRELGQLSSGEITSLHLATDDYEAVGSLAHALARHADEALEEVAPAQNYLAEILFRRLTERGTGRRDTRAPARAGEVAAVAEASIADVAAVVEVFRGRERHFVTAPDGELHEGTLLDIGHESLIRQWGTLAMWVDAEAESATTYRRLVDFGRLWKKNAAGLWRPPELEQALAWQRAQRPNAAWAARYSSADDFVVAMEFLKASELEWQAEEARAARREEDERRRERERIEQEAQRERLEAVAKAARAEAELERAKAVAERQGRRNRALRLTTALLAIGLIGLLAYGIGHRYLQVWEHTEYYASYVKKWGVPSGIGAPLTRAQVKARDATFKLVRRGLWGPVIRMESVDGAGRFATRGGSAAGYLGDSGDDDNDANRTVEWEYVYRNDGDIAYEVELDAHGRQVASMVYMPTGSDKRQRTAHFFGPGGERVAPSQSCADYVQIELSPEGYEARVRYMSQGRPAPGRDRALQIEQHYDASGNATEIISLDVAGKPMTDLFGNAVARGKYDAMGNTVESALYDERGALTVGREGWATSHFAYDSNGLHRETSVFDEAGHPTLHKEGWHRVSRVRDAAGHVVSEQYWGLNGEPAMVSGCHEFRLEYDSRGRVQTTRCIGPDGNPHSESSLGMAMWRRAYDDNDNVVEWTYFDAKGTPINNSDDYHRGTVKYDDRGHAVEFGYFKTDGKAGHRDGYARLTLEFQGDKETRRVYFDADGKPVVPKEVGYAERRFEYDRSGNRVLTSYFDEAGRPKEQGAGYFAQRSVYDGCGQLTETWYLDANRNPRPLPTSKYAGVRYERDRLGRATRTTFLSQQGTPVLTTGGVAGWMSEYDSRGNLLEERYFGTDGRPTLYDKREAALRMSYDRRGNKIREEYLGFDGKAATNIEARVTTRSYNMQNQLVESSRSYFQIGTDTLLGVEKVTYNDLGQKVDEAYFGADGRPFLRQTNNGDCARLHFVYDAAGRVTERQCFDDRGERRKTR